MHEQQDFSVYTLRRQELVSRIKADNKVHAGSVVLICAGFEHDRVHFLQESSFFYFTGLEEPAAVALLDFEGASTLYLPQCGVDRAIWIAPMAVALEQNNSSILGFDTITCLGQKVSGYQMHPFFTAAEYEYLRARLASVVASGGSVFTCIPKNTSDSFAGQRFVVERLQSMIAGMTEVLVDISPIVASMRRVKTAEEVEYISRAIEVTAVAQEAAGKAIADGVNESEVQASLEYMITGSGARMAFPSIVASGVNGTILHYHSNDRTMLSGDLVVVDIGAQVQGYCADITRTYPVSGSFTKRQKELYQLVLDVQSYIADLAKPGMWLSNKEHPEQSLNHLAKKYLADHGGYDQYMPHGIGHFLGLDVHDVGDSLVPLQEGDVITIEPGIYIRQEGIGIRIEDNYWIVAGGAVCLSDEIPKQMREVEALVKERFSA
ncbi:MAG: aminopeptidase P N-terminal domain-containing protein [Epsilonproteobacteria bacterium]|nr:aminopeptidase P N-terminal domain-containing protein [Campylobacterota bacterium]